MRSSARKTGLQKMKSRFYVRTLIIKHLVSNLTKCGDKKESLDKTIKTLSRIWNIDYEKNRIFQSTNYSIIDYLSLIDDSVSCSQQLLYINEQDLKNANLDSVDNDKIQNIAKPAILYPLNPVTHCNVAAHFFKVGLYQQSLEEAKKAREIDPHYVTAYIREGLAHWALGSIEEAREIYNKGLEISPGNHIILNNLELLNNKDAKPPEPALKINKESMNYKEPELSSKNIQELSKLLTLNHFSGNLDSLFNK